MNRRAQQEIVGFVLIVVIVMIAMMVLLIISVSDSDDGAPSAKVSNMLDVLMKKTTECAIVYEPDYDNFEDLVKSCYKEDSCANLDVSACEYLNERSNRTLGNSLSGLKYSKISSKLPSC